MATDKNFIVKNGLEVGGQEVISSSGVVSSAALGGQTLGTTDSPTFANTTLTGSLRGPATFTIDPAAVGDNTGTLVIAGNLQVDGTTTTINSTTMEVDDLNITLASGAANAAAANGAGITVDGASATITYDGTNDEWDFNKDINVTGNVGIGGASTLATLETRGNEYSARFFGTTTANGLQIYHDETNTIAKLKATNSGGDLMLEAGTASGLLLFETGGSERMRIDSAGTVIVTGAAGNANKGILQLSTQAATYQLVGGNNIGYLGYKTGGYHRWFGSDGLEDMRIDASGNVGIGTNSPDNTLMVQGASTDGSGSTGNVALFEGPSGTNGLKIFIDDTENAAGLQTIAGDDLLLNPHGGNVGIGTSSPAAKLAFGDFGQIWVNNDASNPFGIDTVSGELRLFTGNSAAYQMKFGKMATDGTTFTSHLTIGDDGSNRGNVGIGTDSPQSILNISDTAPILRIDSTGSSQDSKILFVEDGSPAVSIFYEGSAGTGTDNNLHIRRELGGSETNLVTVGLDGNVGIGTTSPSFPLHTKTTGNTVAKFETSLTSDLAIQLTNSQGSMFFGLGGGEEFAVGTTSNLNGTGNLFAIKQDGKVGIGTISPFYSLDVNTIGRNSTGEVLLTAGNASSNDYTQSTLLRLRATSINPNSTNHNSINAAVSEIRLNHTDLAGNASGGTMTFHTNPGNNIAGALAERMRIDSSGNVGIGTDSPVRPLHIHTTSNSQMQFTDNTSGSTTSDGLRVGWNGTLGQVFLFENADLRFATNNEEKMRIDSSGNVGIGTANPVSAGSGTKSLHVSATGEARLVLTGDNNNSGDTGQLDAAIYMLTDASVSTDPFGNTSSTNAGAHGYSFRVKNYSGDNTFDMMEEAAGVTTNLMHMNTAGDVVLGFGSTSVSAGAKFEVASTTSMVIPKGTTAQRPGSAVSGAVRFNTTLGNLEQYDGSSWRMVSTVYGIDYLVLGGGGSGGDCTSPSRFGGGGGAGGLRTSYGTVSGRASTAENPLMVTSGHTLTITVGAGASGGVTTDNTAGTQGSSSSITGTAGITTITALGGGGGGGNEVGGTSGGCGGGGSESNGVGKSGTIGQGFDGGTGSESGDRGGGGGGTGANGTGTNGGAGTSVNITGSAVTYGGGGATSGSGGSGGGGAGSTNGTANLGGGGGAAGSQTGAGGSGVVILRIPTANYSGTTTGSPTVTTNGDFKVIKFTSSGTYTT